MMKGIPILIKSSLCKIKRLYGEGSTKWFK